MPTPTAPMTPANKSITSFVPPTLSSLNAFSNANLIHQKRLHLNSSLLTKCRNDFKKLMQQYKQLISQDLAGPCHGDPFNQLVDLSQRYDKLLESRRATLQTHSTWLEQALNAPQIMFADELLEALKTHEETTQSLVTLTEEQPFEQEWASLATISTKQTNTSTSTNSTHPLSGVSTKQPPYRLTRLTDIANATTLFQKRLRPSSSHLNRAKAALEDILSQYRGAVRSTFPSRLVNHGIESKFNRACEVYEELWQLQQQIVTGLHDQIEACSEETWLSDEYAHAMGVQQEAAKALQASHVGGFKSRFQSMKVDEQEGRSS